MLPATIVGTVTTAEGAQPFTLDSATGVVRVGSLAEPDRDLALLGPAERKAVEQQVRAAVPGARGVRVAELRCPRCQRWVDVARHPEQWAGDRCRRC